MAISRRRLSIKLMQQAMEATLKLSCFVVFILLGATVFSLTFQAIDGSVWVEHLLTGLPGGQIGFLIVVNLLVFFLAFFLDFFELAFIIIPLLGPVADKLGIDLVWFGVLMAVNMQTSFMHPPFGFALFYLRSVAPHSEYVDRLTKKTIAPVTTMQIYWGAVPFVIIQVIMVGLIIAFPNLVTGSADKAAKVDIQNIQLEAPPAVDLNATANEQDKEKSAEKTTEKAAEKTGEKAEEDEKEDEENDAAKALQQSINKGK
jgi:GntP family gluconate:H+ symporter